MEGWPSRPGFEARPGRPAPPRGFVPSPRVREKLQEAIQRIRDIKDQRLDEYYQSYPYYPERPPKDIAFWVTDPELHPPILPVESDFDSVEEYEAWQADFESQFQIPLAPGSNPEDEDNQHPAAG